MATRIVTVGNVTIGGEAPIVVQTMCNTHTSDVEASVRQCVELYEAGAQMIRLTVPTLSQVETLQK
jgi:(E)-4-hydroxy-3-methylbut-2-enyl-diphosphate synthase